MESMDRGNLDARSWCIIRKLSINGKSVSSGVVIGGRESASIFKVHGPHTRSCIVILCTGIR